MRIDHFLSAVLIPCIIFATIPVTATPTPQTEDVQKAKSATEIYHKPAERAETGKQIAIYTEVADPKGIDEVRAYFKAQDAANYNYIVLQPSSFKEKGLFESFASIGSDFRGQAFSGVLPAPANGCKAFEYLILVNNKANVVVKSQTYKVTVIGFSSEARREVVKIQVFTDLPNVPEKIDGFSDNIFLDVAESGARFGIVAGLYSEVVTPSFTTTAAAGGTVAASSGGFTTTAVVVAGITTAAVVGGVAAAGGGGNGSNSNDTVTGGGSGSTGTTGSSSNTTTSTGEGTVKITYPSEGSNVGWRDNISGVSNNCGSGCYVSITIQPDGYGEYLQNRGIIDSNGNWLAQDCYYGLENNPNDIGRGFTIKAELKDSGANTKATDRIRVIKTYN